MKKEKKKKRREAKWKAIMYHERSNEDKIENYGDTTIIFNTASSKHSRNQRTILTYRVCNLISVFTFQNGR